MSGLDFRGENNHHLGEDIYEFAESARKCCCIFIDALKRCSERGGVSEFGLFNLQVANAISQLVSFSLELWDTDT